MDTLTIVAIVLWGTVLLFFACLRFLVSLAMDSNTQAAPEKVAACVSVGLILRAIMYAVLPLGASIAGMTLPASVRETMLSVVSPSDVTVASIAALFAMLVAIHPLKDAWIDHIRPRFISLMQKPGEANPAAQQQHAADDASRRG